MLLFDRNIPYKIKNMQKNLYCHYFLYYVYIKVYYIFLIHFSLLDVVALILGILNINK